MNKIFYLLNCNPNAGIHQNRFTPVTENIVNKQHLVFQHPLELPRMNAAVMLGLYPLI